MVKRKITKPQELFLGVCLPIADHGFYISDIFVHFFGSYGKISKSLLVIFQDNLVIMTQCVIIKI